MPERLNRRLRWEYPSAQDAKDALKFVPPSLLLLVASVVRPFSHNKGEAISELTQGQTESLDKFYQKARILAVPGIIGSLGLFVVLSYKELQNRVHFGEHLTVSKVALHPKSFGVKLFPELEDEQFVGEIHFKGKWKLRYSPQENAHSVMRKLFSDLYELSRAVERRDPALADFNYFLGLSSMVTPLLEKFGFKVVPYKEEVGLPALGQDKQSKLKLEMRPVMAALISKQDLVEHQDILYRASRR